LPLQQWPDEDRKLWQTACAPADPLDEHWGARAQHSAIANRNVQRGYGRWLTYLHSTEPACLEDTPANRVTPERVLAYVACLVGLQNGTAAILSRLKELRSAATVCRPWRCGARRLARRLRQAHRRRNREWAKVIRAANIKPE
jgi:hypothetical protein